MLVIGDLALKKIAVVYLAHEDVPVAVYFSSCSPQGYILLAVARIRILSYNRSQKPRSNKNLVAGKPRAPFLPAGEPSPEKHPNAHWRRPARGPLSGNFKGHVRAVGCVPARF